MLGKILRFSPKRLILFPEKGYLQVKWEKGEYKGEFVKNFGNLVIEEYDYPAVLLKFQESLRVFKIYALLWYEVDFYIKRGIKVEEFVGGLPGRWEENLRGWNIRTMQTLNGKYFLAYKRTNRASIRFLRVKDGIKRLKFPRRMNILAVFEGDFTFEGAVRVLREYFEKAGYTFKSPEIKNGTIFGKYYIKIMGDSILLVHIPRAVFRVVFERFKGGYQVVKNLLMPIKLDKIPETVKIRLSRLGFKFSGNSIISVPELPISFAANAIENFIRESTGIEGEDDFIKKLSKALSEDAQIKDVENFIFELFMCKNPYQDPEGNVIIKRISLDEINEYFGENI
ncbi:MAG: hypothetical protein ABIL16_07115 [candidate division WOR-3 bacterium]